MSFGGRLSLPTSEGNGSHGSHSDSVIHTCGCPSSEGRICMWGVGHLRPAQVRRWIARAVGHTWETSVTQVVRTSQAMTTRYDLSVKSDAVQRVLVLLRRVKRLAGWRVRMHECRCWRVSRPRRGDSR